MIRSCVAAAIAVVTTAALASPVQAEERRAAGYVRANPNPAVLRADRSTWVTITVKFDTTRPLYVGGVFATIRTSAGGGGYLGENLNGPDANGVATGKVQFSGWEPAGNWRIETTAITTDGGDEVQGPTGTLRVQKATKVGLTAKPKTVRKGKTVKLGGLLSITGFASWDPFPRRWVSLYFRKPNAKKWTYVGKAKTSSTGRYSKTVKPKASGVWQAHYLGGATYTPATSKGVTIRVR